MPKLRTLLSLALVGWVLWMVFTQAMIYAYTVGGR